jgi:AcrR family transcriptional regulator
MARTAKITDEKILEAARAVFLEEGFSAQTAKIAQRANVSEGSIFKRFPTKEALFFAALEIDRHPAWHEEIVQRVGKGDCRENLIALGLSIIRPFHAMLARTITKMGAHPGPHTFKGLPEHPIIADKARVSRYLQEEIDLGRLRSCKADLVAGVFFGSLIHPVFTSMITGQTLTDPELVEIVEGTIAIFWNGIAPAGAEA